MKILFVIYGIDNKVMEEACCKKNDIRRQTACRVDACVYAKREEIEKLDLEILGGKIYVLEAEACISEAIAKSISGLCQKEGYTSVVVGDGGEACELASELAETLEADCVTMVTEFIKENDFFFCKKMVYNNLAQAKYKLEVPFVVSERFASGAKDSSIEPLDRVELELCKTPDYILNQEIDTLRQAQVISPILIAVGMGIQTKEEIEQIRKYAKDKGFSFGVSRPVAMRGWADINEIIGVSGRIYAPDITIAIGISGAAAFMAGVEKSKYILAINTNETANIAKHSDAMIVDDYQNILSSLLNILPQ